MGRPPSKRAASKHAAPDLIAADAPRGEIRAFKRSLPMALLKAREAVMSRFRPTLHAHDLTEQQWRVLRALTTAEEFRAGELARVSSISMPSLSRILRALEKRALIQRGVEDKDLRAAQISITTSGRELIALIAPHSERRYAEITTAFGEDRLATLYGLLDELTACLNDGAEAPPEDEE
ncbi:homoprotocatechuate degradation operon regulator HpaR [Azospirillum sp.]|uniref:homoprotocatechuate degradation operon regulator HpaR n=1 Tax=Azospirillum sp. TaxID=34012 RepID=UPI0026152990|nr:homoprotocatechuate degradation operon regulator HpaR [Azospirillum sp.]